MRSKIEGGKKFDFFTASIVFLVFARIYCLPSVTAISVGEIILCFAIILAMLKNKRLILPNMGVFYCFFFYAVLSSLLIAILHSTGFNDVLIRLLRDTLYWAITIIFSANYLKYDLFLKYIKIAAIVTSVMVVLQEIVFLLTGFLIPGFFLNADLSVSSSALEIYQHTVKIAIRNGYLKAPGFFTEGAHCAHMLVISSVLLMDFDKKKKKGDLKLLLLFMAACVLTFSASGLAYVGFVALAYLIFVSNTDSAVKKKLLLIVGGCICFIGVIAFFDDGNAFTSVFNRIFSALDSDSVDGSAFLRIYKGFNFWINIPFVYKLFGIGFGNYNNMRYLYSGALL